MKRGTADHPKVKELATLLNVPRAHAVGMLAVLWDWASKYTPAGDVGKYPNTAIARQLDWEDDPDTLIRALIESHLLDSRDSCRLFIHDWPDHCEDSVHAHLARHAQFFANGQRPSLKKLGREERLESERRFKEAEDKALRTSRNRRPKAASGGRWGPKAACVCLCQARANARPGRAFARA